MSIFVAMVPDEQEEEEAKPEYIIENARSGRSKCKGCRKLIAKDDLRLGVLVEGPYGLGHMWYHVECSAKNVMPKLEEAYASAAWENAKVPPDVSELPDLEGLRELGAKALAEKAEKAKNRKVIPYAEVVPSDRSKCKHSGEAIPKDSVRIVLGKEAQFGSQVRTSPYQVLPRFALVACEDPEVTTEPGDLVELLRQNSKIDASVLEAALSELG